MRWGTDEPTKLDVTYDDVLFRIADLVPDFDPCDFDADGDCDIVNLDELQYLGLGGDDAKFGLDVTTPDATTPDALLSWVIYDNWAIIARWGVHLVAPRFPGEVGRLAFGGFEA